VWDLADGRAEVRAGTGKESDFAGLAIGPEKVPASAGNKPEGREVGVHPEFGGAIRNCVVEQRVTRGA